jgi:hypothetical protein
MRRLTALLAASALVLGLVGVTMANGDSDRNSFKTRLSGFQEVPAISTTGTGSLKITVNGAGTQLSYTLTYSNLKGGAAGAAHIHLGQSGVSGGIAAFLCGGSKPACPGTGGTISGTIVAADVQAIAAQGLAAGDLGALLKAMRAGVTYANVHNATFGGGEIRGQIGGRGNGKGD